MVNFHKKLVKHSLDAGDAKNFFPTLEVTNAISKYSSSIVATHMSLTWWR